MTSPHPGESSPGLGTSISKSHFTYRQFSQLASYSTSTPLRVIAHIDLDAFYAQCEMVRLGVPAIQPLAVQQWQGLIAINYAARKFGIGRHCTVTEAKKLCPELIAQHVATWREGDEKWAYRPDAASNIASDKVSLDPYRLESRKILALIKESLPADMQKVEKASIDEVFCDLSAHVHSVLLDRFPELKNPPPYDDPTEKLPRPPIAALDWQGDVLVDLDEHGEMESEDPDWDDVAILIGSEIIRGVRERIHDKLHYTCSAGVANNKMLSKLGSGHKKPNQQTVIRGRAVGYFLSACKLTKIRNLGGKLGDTVVSTFKTDSIDELLLVSLEQMKAKLGDETGTWVHNTVRGIDASEVNPRTQIKSMLSAKSFRPTIHTTEQALKWLRIFAADIFARVAEEGGLEKRRRPKTINLHHRHEGQTKSRQGPIPQGKPLDEETLFGLASGLLRQIVSEGRVWPCANLSLSVGGFEDAVTGNQGIGAFLVRGEEAQALRQSGIEAGSSHSMDRRDDPGVKKRRLESGGIYRFLSHQTLAAGEGSAASKETDEDPAEAAQGDIAPPVRFFKSNDDEAAVLGDKQKWTRSESPPVAERQLSANLYDARMQSTATAEQQSASATKDNCPRCNATFTTAEDQLSHADWHLAKDLQEEEERRGRGPIVVPERSTTSARGGGGGGNGGPAKRGSRGRKREAGQRKLTFG